MNDQNSRSLAKFWPFKKNYPAKLPKFLSWNFNTLKSEYNLLVRSWKYIHQNWPYWTKIWPKNTLAKNYFLRNGDRFGITRIIICKRAPYFQNLNFFAKFGKTGDFAIFWKMVFFQKRLQIDWNVWKLIWDQ